MGCEHDNCMPALPIMQGNYPEDLAQIMANELKRVWQEKGMPKALNVEITQAYAYVFLEALQQGYGVNLADFDYTTPDGVMLNKLKENIYQFSAAKNYTQLQQLSKALLDENEKLRSFTDFKKEAFAITQQHNISWLKAEYDLAINSAQMARKWVEIQAQKNSLPLLQFDATIDTRTSPYCRGFDGVIKPVDDAFWDIYYPPNHYNCRSIVRQLNQGIVTANETIVYPDKPIPKLFQTNLAKTGLLFPDTHPYFIDLPNSLKEEYIKALPYDMQFQSIDTTLYKGRLRKHRLYKAGQDHDIILQEAAQQASEGNTVDIMPTINNDDAWHKIIFYDAYKNKSPDLRINGKLFELEGNKKGTYRSIKGSIEAGQLQSPNIIVILNKHFEKSMLEQIISLKFKDYSNIESVTIKFEGRVLYKKRRKP